MSELVWEMGLTERSMLGLRSADGSKQEVGYTGDMELEVDILVHQALPWTAA